jgi:hypothetical protein
MKTIARLAALLTMGIAIVPLAPHAQAQQHQSEAELANKLNNPVASMISVPFQYNWDEGYGPQREGHKAQLNIQPVVPARLGPDWTLISRVIVPIVSQRIPTIGDGSQNGVGDITGEFFFVPSRPGPGGTLWGAGPALLVPTHSDFISAKKWGLGPTAVVVKQERGLTYGVLANHIWSVAGNGPQAISSTFVQPFLSYTTPQAWTFGINAESSYDWKQSQWTVPVHATVSRLVRIGKQPTSFGASLRYWADSPSSGPHGWGARLTVTLLLPEETR